MLKDRVNCNIEARLKAYAIEHGLGFTNALEFGLLFLAYEKGLMDPPMNSLSRKIEKLSDKLGEAMERIEELESATGGGEKKIYPEDCYGN